MINNTKFDVMIIFKKKNICTISLIKLWNLNGNENNSYYDTLAFKYLT